MQSVGEQVFAGWSFGHQHGITYSKDAEIRQGKNYILSSLAQAGQWTNLSSLAGILVDQMKASAIKTALRISTFISPFLGLIAFPFCAVVKQDFYSSIAEKINGFQKLISLPKTVHPHVKEICMLVAEHSGVVMYAAGIVAAIAITLFAQPYLGGALLTGLTYTAIDQAGFIPRKTSLFLEKYLNPITSIGVFLYGGLASRVITVLSLTSTFSTSFNHFMQHSVDKIVHYVAQRFFGTTWIQLHEYEAPSKDNTKMSYEEIKRILNDESPYKMVPAHCSKSVLDVADLPTNKDYPRLLTHFKKVNWQSKYAYIRSKLLDDDRFKDYLYVTFKTRLELIERLKNYDTRSQAFDECLTLLGQQSGISKEQYVANWLEAQMTTLVGMLTDEKRPKGEQTDFEDAMNNIERIIPYLDQMDSKRDIMAVEDCLVKLAVEGGDYCARGTKRISSEIVDTILLSADTHQAILANDPTAYKKKIMAGLLQKRQHLIQKTYNDMLNREMGANAVSSDVHVYDMYRYALSLGFVPLTKNEREKVNLSILGLWEFYSLIRQPFENAYKRNLDTVTEEIIKEIGLVDFAPYMAKLIGENNRLTEQQKEEFLDMMRDPAVYEKPETQAAFRRLLLVSFDVVEKS